MAKKKNTKELDEKELQKLMEALGDNVSTRPSILDFKLDVKCKNEKQKDFLKLMKNKKKVICFGIGSPGTGKSYLSLAFALKELKDEKYDKVVMIVPTAPAGGLDLNLGYLKGDFEDKTRPFKECDEETITKILKNSGNDTPKKIAKGLINGGYIKYEFINFVLGKTFDNALILVNEAEQYTKENMRLLLTRIGEDSKIIITGDIEQTNRRDIVNKKSACGLDYAAEKLSQLEEVGVTEFTRDNIVRNPLITKIIDAWD